MVSQKSFINDAEQLIKASESSYSDIEREVEKSLVEDSGEKESRLEKKSKQKKKGAVAEEKEGVEENNVELEAGEEN
jgi:hypothetical protein